MLSAIFDQFVEASPISVMARGLMENIFAAERMNKIFETHAQQQFQLLKYLAEFVHLKRFLKHPRGVKKKRSPLMIEDRKSVV